MASSAAGPLASLPLALGDELPALGLGLWKLDASLAPKLVVEAAKLGYRHFDSACDYGNETAVGEGLQKIVSEGICRREEMWVTSKLWNTYHRPEHVAPALKRTLSDLKLDYLDLYLIHFPIATQYIPFETRYPPGWFYDPSEPQPSMRMDQVPIIETWRAMESLVDVGLVRHIGVCNFNTSLLRDLLSQARRPVEVLQVESHPYLVQSKLLRFCNEHQIVYTAFSPLGAPSYVPLGMASADQSVLTDPVVVKLAQAKQKTPAQIVLRWGVQRGTSVIPKTSSVARLRENIDLDFRLTQEEMDVISGLDRHQRFNDPGVFCEKAFNTFCPIYE